MDPLLNTQGYIQSQEDSDDNSHASATTFNFYSTSTSEINAIEEYNNGQYYDASTTEYAAEDLEALPEKQPDLALIDGWLVEGGRIALPREITVRLERMKWNAAFQTNWETLLQRMSSHEFDIKAIAETMVQIHNLYTEFVRTARFYAELLVKEKFNQNKSVKVINVGGIAGGDKYTADGIFFKFSTDTSYIYQSESNAAKAAGLELRSLDAMISMNHVDLSFPLLAVFDYYGYRVTCMSLLPVGSKTQKYGSSTGGKTVLLEDDDMVNKIENLARAMNLAKHIGGCVKETAKALSLAVDCEGHRGTDGRIYILDTARAMPPEPPSGRGTLFYRLFRHEFVRSYSKPLCSDAFAFFCRLDPNEKQYQIDVQEAFNYYISTHVPQVVDILENRKDNSEILTSIQTPDNFLAIRNILQQDLLYFERENNLKSFLHSHGINVRHLGIVFSCCKTDYWKKRVATEMVLRICKNTARILFRRAFEKFQSPNNEAFTKFIVDYLNLVSGDSEQATEYWDGEIIESIRLSYFYYQGAAFDEDYFRSLRKELNDTRLFLPLMETFGKMTGVTFKDLTEINFDTAQPCQVSDLGSLKPTSKELSIFALSELFFHAHSILTAKNMDLKPTRAAIDQFLDLVMNIQDVPINPFYNVMIAMIGHEVYNQVFDLYLNRAPSDRASWESANDCVQKYHYFHADFVYKRLLQVIVDQQAMKRMKLSEHQQLLSFLLKLTAEETVMGAIGRALLCLYYKGTKETLKYEETKEAVLATDLVFNLDSPWHHNFNLKFFAHLKDQFILGSN